MRQPKLFIAIQKGHGTKSEIKIINPEQKSKYSTWHTLKGVNRKKKFLKHVTLAGKHWDYVLFEDGTIYSEYLKRFLKPGKQPGRTKNSQHHFIYTLTLKEQEQATYQLQRLIYFHFGKHNFTTMKEMGSIITLDNNPGNINIENLVIQGGVKKKNSSNIKTAKTTSPNPAFQDNKKDETLVEIRYLIWSGNTMDEIGAIFNTSHASVSRFLNNKIGVSAANIRKELETLKRILVNNPKIQAEIIADVPKRFGVSIKQFKKIREYHNF